MRREHGLSGRAIERRRATSDDCRVDDELALSSLLGRPVVDVDVREFDGYLAGATVLVSGAGGSLGSELCVRLALLGTRRLVLIDNAEGSLVELTRALPPVRDTVPVLADIRNRKLMFDVFDRYRPDVVFHAAAYKHVPLLEAFPIEGAATNVLGTSNVVDAARQVGVGRFVLFSTDKAVRPTNILGQTKAVAEWIVSAAGRAAGRAGFTSVRLVNVVDSAGSTLPLFRRQVRRGEPITVTHPEATRYLMTAGEASALAIVAGGLADSESAFWLDTGPPVSVLDLARQLASASHDVRIDFVGLRPGERLHERPYSEEDEIEATACDRVWRSAMPLVDPAWLSQSVAALAEHVGGTSTAGVRAELAGMITGSDAERAPPALSIAR